MKLKIKINGNPSEPKSDTNGTDIEALNKKERELEELLANDTKRVDGLVKAFQANFPPYISAYSTYSKIVPEYQATLWDGEPKYTNYTNWKGTLDYIFIQRDVDNRSLLEVNVSKVLSLPTEHEMEPGLPNDSFSSDHVFLMTRLDLIDRFKEKIS